jgi:hypothetical protein
LRTLDSIGVAATELNRIESAYIVMLHGAGEGSRRRLSARVQVHFSHGELHARNVMIEDFPALLLFARRLCAAISFLYRLKEFDYR